MFRTTRHFANRAGMVSRALALVALAAVTPSLIPTGADAYVNTPIFRSQGQATEAADPQNPDNDVIKFTTNSSATGFASVTRDLRAKNLKIADMTNTVSVKYFVVSPRLCIGGSPRFQLNIDTQGNGSFVRNAWGYFGNKAFGGDCPSDMWVYEDLANPANPAKMWDLSSLGGGMTMSWAEVVAFVNTQYPNHKLRACGVFDDSGWAAGGVGTVYLDNVQCHDRVLEDHLDVSPGTNDPF